MFKYCPILLLFQCTCVFLNAQQIFPELSHSKVKNNAGITFAYPQDPEYTLFNTSCENYNRCVYKDYSWTLLFSLESKKHGIIDFYFSEGNSDDPTFHVFKNGIEIFQEYGERLFLKKSLTLYIEGNTNAYFNKKRKYVMQNGKYEETKQAFYAINKKGNLNQTVTIYRTENFKEKVAVLPKGYPVEIVLGQLSKETTILDKILIQSKFGLLGWFNMNEIPNNEILIEGLYFHGD